MKNATAFYAAATTLFLSLATSLISFGQESHGAILLNMVTSRMNYGEMNSAVKGHKDDVHGIQAGLSWQAGLTRRFSIVTEAYFITKGGSIKGDVAVEGIKSSLRLHTVEVPVLARLHAGRFYFNAGPYVNYIFSGKASSNAEGSRSITFGQNHFRKFEAGFHSGLGYRFNIKKTKMAADFRYISGMTSVSRSEDLYNRTLNISVLVLNSWGH